MSRLLADLRRANESCGRMEQARDELVRALSGVAEPQLAAPRRGPKRGPPSRHEAAHW